jgi:hypothetical protein
MVSVICALLVIPTSLFAETKTLTFQHGDGGAYSDMQGTFLDLFNKTGSGSDEVLWVGGEALEVYSVSLLRFPDIFGNNPGQIPPGSTIESATLHLTHYFPSAHAALLSFVASAWDEDTATGASPPTLTGDVASIPAGDAGTVYAADVTSALVAWSQDPALNWGLEIRQGPTVVDLTYMSFYSDDTATQAVRPLLSVTFTPVSTATEQSTWGRVKALYR